MRAEPHWTLTWTAPSACPQREEVLLAVRDIVGAQIFETSTLVADGEIRETSGKFRLVLRVTKDGGEQERAVDAKMCEDLLGAAAIVLGLHMKRIAAEDDAQAAPAPGTDAPTPATGEPSASPGAEGVENAAVKPSLETTREPDNSVPLLPSAAASRTRSFWLGLPAAGLVIGSLPEPEWTLGASVGWRRERWRLWVSGRYQLPQTIASRAVDEVAAVVDKYTVEVGVSHGWGGRFFDAAPGVFAGLDYLVARSQGENVTAARAQQPVAFLGAGMALRWLASDWLSVALGVAGEIPLSPPALRVQSLGEIEKIRPVHLRVSLGLEWNF